MVFFSCSSLFEKKGERKKKVRDESKVFQHKLSEKEAEEAEEDIQTRLSPPARRPSALFLAPPPALFSRGSSREPRERVALPPARARRGFFSKEGEEKKTCEERASKKHSTPRKSGETETTGCAPTCLSSPVSIAPCDQAVLCPHETAMPLSERASGLSPSPGTGAAIRVFFFNRERERRKIQREAHLASKSDVVVVGGSTEGRAEKRKRFVVPLPCSFLVFPRGRCRGVSSISDMTA